MKKCDIGPGAVLVVLILGYFLTVGYWLRPAMGLVPPALSQGELDATARTWAARRQLYVQGVHCLPGGRGDDGTCTVHTEAGEKIHLLCGNGESRGTACRADSVHAPRETAENARN